MKTIEADIFEQFEKQSNVMAVHCVNCFHTMGGGIAKIIKDRYPKVYDVDCRTEYGDIKKLGTYSFAKVGDDEKYIANLYAQFTYGKNHFGDRELSYDAFYNGFQKILKDIENSEIKTVLVPYQIGCGLAMGSWEIVENILDTLSKSFTKDIVICKLT